MPGSSAFVPLSTGAGRVGERALLPVGATSSPRSRGPPPRGRAPPPPPPPLLLLLLLLSLPFPLPTCHAPTPSLLEYRTPRTWHRGAAATARRVAGRCALTWSGTRTDRARRRSPCRNPATTTLHRHAA